MGGWIELILAVASLITSLGGASAAVIVSIRSNARQSKKAAQRSNELTEVMSGQVDEKNQGARTIDPRELARIVEIMKKMSESKEKRDDSS